MRGQSQTREIGFAILPTFHGGQNLLRLSLTHRILAGLLNQTSGGCQIVLFESDGGKIH